MHQFPLVSLCIPIYNGVEYIQPMLSSVRQSTYPNLEIIISDDGSQDNSLDFIYSAQLPRAQIFYHNRYGLVANWNYCISKATGRYIKFLFQDDVIEPDCIGKMVEVAEKDEKIGLVFSRRNVIYENSAFDPGIEELHKSWQHLQLIQAGIDLLQDANLLKPPFNKIGEPTNVLLRRDIFEHIGLFDSAFQQLPDLEMWFRIMAYYKIAFIDEKLASFRIHPNQTTKHNITHQEEQTWAEIYQVWLKLICDSTYKVVIPSVRQKIKIRLLKILIREYLKSIVYRKLHRCMKITALLIQTLSA